MRLYNDKREVIVKIVDIRHYDTLYDYLIAEGFDNVLPYVGSFEESIDIYHKFYPDELIEQSGGMLALELKVIAASF